ncbi:ATP-binding cassette domain-containing protein [Brachybacterium muris]|uniref:ATP-binding cassette domain-containing protein n=1 Tax=Brachybacterium muris TaxID=219301 RepID=UPI0005AB274E
MRFGEVLALPRTSLQVAPSESVAIMGPSGSGKSTLLSCIQGLIPPTSGIVMVLGQDQALATKVQRSDLRRRRMGLIQQNPDLLPEFSTVENVAFPLLFDGMKRADAVKRAKESLARVDLAHRSNADVRTLSGGEAQRVAVARALIHPDVALLIADEPTAALDAENAYLVTSLLTSEATRHDAALILATHDRSVASLCSRTVRISREHETL